MYYILLFWSCSNSEKPNRTSQYDQEITNYWKGRNSEMAKEGSPLPKEERKNFISLNYFKPNENFKFKAHFELLFSQNSFKMATNTDRSPTYTPFARITFQFEEKTHSLTAYKNGELKANKLFLPFTDLTNSKSTYSTGRYIDLTIPEKDSIEIDFNLSYNPYCAYNKHYSCPIPPSENHLSFMVNAGERKYH